MRDLSEKQTRLRIISGNKAALRRMVGPNEASLMFSVSPGTLGNWRSAKKGPRFFKVGHKILYRVEDLEAFFTSTPVLTLDSVPGDR